MPSNPSEVRKVDSPRSEADIAFQWCRDEAKARGIGIYVMGKGVYLFYPEGQMQAVHSGAGALSDCSAPEEITLALLYILEVYYGKVYGGPE